MRRLDKQIQNEDLILDILNRSEICRIGFAANNIPYVVPVNYVHHNNQLIIHSAPEGKKIELIKQNPNICFELELHGEVVPGEKACDWTTKYRSAIGTGTIRIENDREKKTKYLDLLMLKHAGNQQFEYNQKLVDRMVVLIIDIKEVSAKQSGDWEK